MAEVYWIHLPEHTDMFSEGYIGFTSRGVAERYKEHVTSAKGSYRATSCVKLYRAINKYGAENLVVDTLCLCDKEYGLALEHKLRPLPQVGWNIALGGSAPTLGKKLSPEAKSKISATMSGRKFSDEHRSNMSKAAKGKVVSEETCRNISKAKTGLPGHKHTDECKARLSKSKRLYNHPQCVKDAWVIAHQIYDVHTIVGLGCGNLANLFGSTASNMLHMIKSFKAGWNPYTDADYWTWREAYLKEKENHAT